MELSNLILKVVNLQFIQHHDVMVPVVSQQAFEANRAKAILTESLNVFFPMDLAFRKVRVSVRYRINFGLLLLGLFLRSYHELGIVHIVRVMARRHILCISFVPDDTSGSTAINTAGDTSATCSACAHVAT